MLRHAQANGVDMLQMVAMSQKLHIRVLAVKLDAVQSTACHMLRESSCGPKIAPKLLVCLRSHMRQSDPFANSWRKPTVGHHPRLCQLCPRATTIRLPR